MEQKNAWQERMDERKTERDRLLPSNVVVAFVYLFIWLAFEKQVPSWEKFFNAVAGLSFAPLIIGGISTFIMEINRERIDAHMKRKPWVKVAALAAVVIICSAIVTFI